MQSCSVKALSNHASSNYGKNGLNFPDWESQKANINFILILPLWIELWMKSLIIFGLHHAALFFVYLPSVGIVRVITNYSGFNQASYESAFGLSWWMSWKYCCRGRCKDQNNHFVGGA